MRAGSPLLSKLSPLLGGKKKNGRSKTRKRRVIVILYLHMALCVCDVYMLMRGEEGKKKEAIKRGHTNNKAKQYRTPKAVTFPKKIELPRVTS